MADGIGIDGLGARADLAWLRAGSASADPALRERQQTFTEALGRHGVGPKPTEPEDEARRAAEQFVAAVFIQPILKEMRAQNHAPAPFGPTEGEKALAPLVDAQLADRIVRAQQFGLVDRIAHDLRRAGA